MSTQAANLQVTVHADARGPVVDRNIYAHFIEHLATCIYGGIWVGPDSSIPNEDGIRRDTLEALAAIKPPMFRWPGGYFADLYDWRDGIGPREARPTRVCPTEPGREDGNQFGTPEFMRFCRAVGAEPFLCVNTTFLTGNEASHWVEYCNLDGKTTWAQRRRDDGCPEPFGVRYWGIGNESYWRHSPQDYVQRYREWKHLMRNADPSIVIVSSGLEPNWRPEPWGRDDWGTYLIRETRADMDMYSIHTYFSSGPAVEFSDAEYYRLFVELWRRLTRSIEASCGLLDAHSAFPREVKIAIDEWGIWHAGYPMGPDMRQPGTLRDALFAAAFFHVCHGHAERVSMATIAQTLNVAHALIITGDEGFYRTPTYHVFDMMQGHQGGRRLPVHVTDGSTVSAEQAGLENEDFAAGSQGGQPAWENSVPMAAEGKFWPATLWVSATADVQGKGITLSVINLSLTDDTSVQLRFDGLRIVGAKGSVLTAADVRDQNSFTDPDHVVPAPVAVRCEESGFAHVFPRHSLTVLSLATA